MALKQPFYMYFLAILFICNCDSGNVTKYNVMVSENTLGDKEYTIILDGKYTNLTFFPSQRELKTEYVYLKMVTDYNTINNCQQVSTKQILNYNETMKSIAFIMDFMTEHYDMSNLYCFRFNISSFGEESLNMSKLYISQYGNNDNIQPYNVASFIEKSRLIRDLNKIVSTYGLSVDTVNVEDPFFYSINDFLTHNRIETCLISNKPNKVLNSTIYVLFLKKQK